MVVWAKKARRGKEKAVTRQVGGGRTEKERGSQPGGILCGGGNVSYRKENKNLSAEGCFRRLKKMQRIAGMKWC